MNSENDKENNEIKDASENSETLKLKRKKKPRNYH